MSAVQPQAVRSTAQAPRRRLSRRIYLGVLIFLLCLLGGSLVLISPLALERLGDLTTVDWRRLSEVGQTYGAVSAVLAVFAVGGVAISIRFQARQTRASQVQATRQFHLELMRMELENLELYLPCWGPLDIPNLDSQKQQIYSNLIMSHLWMSYQLGSTTDLAIRNALINMFRGEVGRRYWNYSSSYWAGDLGTESLGRRFIEIVNQEHANAIAAGPPIRGNIEGTKTPGPAYLQGDPQRLAISAAFLGGLVAGIMLRARGRDRARTDASGSSPQGRP